MPPQYASRMPFGTFIAEAENCNGGDASLAALLNDVLTACSSIALTVGRGALHAGSETNTDVNVHGEVQKPLDVVANDAMLAECAKGSGLCAMVSEELAEPVVISPIHRRGRYLLVFDPLDGSSNLDVNVTVGTIFSVLRAPENRQEPQTADFLQPGTGQVAAGFALYGPCSMIVLTLGRGVFGFTFDREAGTYTLTHPNMRIAEKAREFAINVSNERFWEPPVRHYVQECIAGRAGPRGEDFNMRWIASMVAEVYRLLIRGGLFMYPRDSKDPSKAGRLRLLYEANPMAMIVEQAGGLASTGRERLLDVVPTSLHQRVPVILGSRPEVERLIQYHAAHDRGDELAFRSPLLNERSMFRQTANG